jgi:hypothetical protein
VAKYSKEFEAWWLKMITNHKYYKFTNAKDAAFDAYREGKRQGVKEKQSS